LSDHRKTPRDERGNFALTPRVGLIDLSGLGILLDQQHATLPIPSPSIHCIEQARALHKPWTVIAIDVQHENQILVFEISAYRRVMASPRSKNHLPIEVNDVTVGWIVGALQMTSIYEHVLDEPPGQLIVRNRLASPCRPCIRCSSVFK
jgi:hypothetical protein